MFYFKYLPTGSASIDLPTSGVWLCLIYKKRNVRQVHVISKAVSQKLHLVHSLFAHFFYLFFYYLFFGSDVAERSGASDSSSGIVRMWVQIPAWPVAALVSLSKTLNHNCFVLRMGRKGVGPVCCVMHVKEPRTLIVKEKRLAPVFLDSRLEHPAGWICARYKSSILLSIPSIKHGKNNYRWKKWQNYVWRCLPGRKKSLIRDQASNI